MENIKILQRIAEIENTRYKSSGDYSVTNLIDPPRLVALSKRHKQEIVPPLSNMIPSMMGTALHEFVESRLKKWAEAYNYEGYTFEEELSIEVAGKKVSGRYDIKDIDILNDNKNTKTWELIFDPEMIKWHQQQNLYAYLLYVSKGIDVKKLLITAWYKDWIESTALRNQNYPREQVEEYELEKWPYEKTEKFLHDRLYLHVVCEDLPDNKLPACTREERWERFPSGSQVEYAIMKTKTAKRAAKVIRTNLCDAMAESKKMKGITKDSFIEVRYAQRKRCEKWCNVKDFCNHYQSYAKAKKNNTLNDYVPLGV